MCSLEYVLLYKLECFVGVLQKPRGAHWSLIILFFFFLAFYFLFFHLLFYSKNSITGVSSLHQTVV